MLAFVDGESAEQKSWLDLQMSEYNYLGAGYLRKF